MPLNNSIINQTLRTLYGERAYKIVEQLTDAGYDTWWVGGGVRDMLLGKVPKDIDIGTSATPKEISVYFPKALETPKALGSVRIPMSTDTFEVTTFREDDEVSDGRHPESIAFSTREKDAARRDFTVNALYFNPISKELFDPYEGEKDLHEKLIRFIGEPATRIKHDALRLMRAVRFRALLDGQYHPDTYTALRELAQHIETLSGSRQLEELEKMLMGPHPNIALEDMHDLGMLQYFLPELSACKGIAQPADFHHEGDVWNHTVQCTTAFREEDKIDIRIATIFHDSGKVQTFTITDRIHFDHHASVSADIATKALTRLQMPKKRIDKIAWLITHHMMMGSFFEMPDDRKSYWYHHPWFTELIQLFYLDIMGTTPSGFDLYNRILEDYHHFLDSHPRPAKPLLTGDEIMTMLNLKPGEEVGRILEQLHKAQIEGKISSKAEAKSFVSSMQTR